MKRSSMVLAVLAWSLVVALGATLTWFVIGTAGAVNGDPVAADGPADASTSAALGVPSPSASVLVGPTAPATSPAPASSPSASRSESPRPSVTPSVRPTPQPPKSPRPSTKPSAKPPATPGLTPAAQVRTWSGPAGSVTTECSGAAIVLRSATPSNGWRVRADGTGPEEVEVTFVADSGEVQVQSRCANGSPTFRVESDGRDH